MAAVSAHTGPSHQPIVVPDNYAQDQGQLYDMAAGNACTASQDQGPVAKSQPYHSALAFTETDNALGKKTATMNSMSLSPADMALYDTAAGEGHGSTSYEDYAPGVGIEEDGLYSNVDDGGSPLGAQGQESAYDMAAGRTQEAAYDVAAGAPQESAYDVASNAQPRDRTSTAWSEDTAPQTQIRGRASRAAAAQQQQQQGVYDMAQAAPPQQQQQQQAVYDAATAQQEAIYDEAAVAAPSTSEPNVHAWLELARTTTQDRKAVVAALKGHGADFGLGCFCFRSSSKAHCMVLCVLVSKDEVASIRCEEPGDGTVLVHDLIARPMPFASMNGVLKYFADPTSAHNNKVPLGHCIPAPGVGSDSRESRGSTRGFTRKGSVYNGFDTAGSADV